jgi:hypothetical protein
MHSGESEVEEEQREGSDGSLLTEGSNHIVTGSQTVMETRSPFDPVAVSPLSYIVS